MKTTIISIINFKASRQQSQWRYACAEKEGFLLIELLGALIIGIFLYSVGVCWQNRIISTRQDALRCLEALHTTHELLEHMVNDPSLIQQKQYKKGNAVCSWQLNNALFNEIQQQLPPTIKLPLFKLITIKASWPGSINQHSAEFTSGFIA